jgi:hypothetical protein
MKEAAVGFRVHSGWSAMVAACEQKGEPLVLYRARVHLVETFTYTFRQPYHTAEQMDVEEAPAFIAQVRAKAQDLAEETIRKLRMTLKEGGYELKRGALLLASGRTLPELDRILASHALIHTADGELFRESVMRACERAGIAVTRIKERELVEIAAKSSRMSQPVLLRRIAKLGKPMGPPWTQDEKFATLGAWLALGGAGGGKQGKKKN